MGEKTYFGGNDLGFVDIALIPFYTSFKDFETFGSLNVESECPKFIAWVNRCLQKESVAESLPDQHKVHEFIAGIRKKLGIELSRFRFELNGHSKVPLVILNVFSEYKVCNKGHLKVHLFVGFVNKYFLYSHILESMGDGVC